VNKVCAESWLRIVAGVILIWMNSHTNPASPVRRMLLLPLTLYALLCACEQTPLPRIRYVHDNDVYYICRHNDSLYYTTTGRGIYRFHPSQPESISFVARAHNLPFRALVFTPGDTLFAISYQHSLWFKANDSLQPYPGCPFPGWTIKEDTSHALWVVGTQGIYCGRAGHFEKFSAMREAHDVEADDSSVVVAHLSGLTVFSRSSRIKIKTYDQSTNYWCVTRYDTVLIAGGLNQCLVICNNTIRKITFGPKGNIVWSTAMDRGTLYLGTQSGLYRALPGETSAVCIANSGVCIKTLFLDHDRVLWAGKFGSH
jgi:hypothetical protein